MKVLTVREPWASLIVNGYKFNSFDELYSNFDKIKLGYNLDEDANPNDMEQYYPKDMQRNMVF